MQDRVSRTEEKPLESAELALLKNRAWRQVAIYLPGYLLLAGGAIYILLDPPGSYHNVVNPYRHLDDDQVARMWQVAPYLSSFILLMATIYFGKIFYQTILPLLRDIKQKTKTLIYFQPKKSVMAFFNRYYISTPLFENQQIELSREDFDSVREDAELHLEVGSHSLLVLRLCNGERQIKY